MHRIALTLVTGAIVAILPFGSAALAAPDHSIAVNNTQTKTWSGTPKLGLNAAINDPVVDRRCEDTEPGSFYYDPRTVCDFVHISATNPVPENDADGKLKRNITITINEFLGGLQPPTDIDFVVYHADADGTKGQRVEGGNGTGWSANNLPNDPDEQVSFSVETTRTVPTKYFLVEVQYFTSLYAVDLCTLPSEVRPTPCAPYKGTVQF